MQVGRSKARGSLISEVISAGIVIISLMVIVAFAHSTYTFWKRRDIVGIQQQKLKELESEHERLNKALTEAQTPEFIERVAREKLGLIKPGETVVILASEATRSADPIKEPQDERKPSWRLWWELFF